MNQNTRRLDMLSNRVDRTERRMKRLRRRIDGSRGRWRDFHLAHADFFQALDAYTAAIDA